jgi:hypothetical protein
VLQNDPVLAEHVGQHRIMSVPALPSADGNAQLEEGILWLAEQSSPQPQLQVRLDRSCEACEGCEGCRIRSKSSVVYAILHANDLPAISFGHKEAMQRMTRCDAAKVEGVRDLVRRKLAAEMAALGQEPRPADWVGAFNRALQRAQAAAGAAAASHAARWRWPLAECAASGSDARLPPPGWHAPDVQARISEALQGARMPDFPASTDSDAGACFCFSSSFAYGAPFVMLALMSVYRYLCLSFWMLACSLSRSREWQTSHRHAVLLLVHRESGGRIHQQLSSHACVQTSGRWLGHHAV